MSLIRMVPTARPLPAVLGPKVQFIFSGNGAPRYAIVRHPRNNRGHYETQALSVVGEWVNRPECFTYDPEVIHRVVFAQPRVKRSIAIIAAVRDELLSGDEPFTFESIVEERCAEMLAWAREHGGRLVLRRFVGPSFGREPGQPRRGGTAAVLMFDRPETAFWFKMRWG